MKTRKWLYGSIAFLFLGGFILVLMAHSTAAQTSDPVERLLQQTDGVGRVSYHAETGKVRFIGTDLAHPMVQPMALKPGATAEEAARQFLGAYGPAFGLTDQAQELTVERTNAIDDGRSVVRFQQVYQGVPVVGGELVVQMNAAKNVLSVDGEVLPDLKLVVTPSLEADVARQNAIAEIAKIYQLDPSDLTATTPELWLVNPAILGGPGPKITSLVWRMDVTPNDMATIKELVFVEAHTGAVVLHFNQNETGLNRTVYDNQNVRSENLALNPAVCTEGNCPGSGLDQDFAYTFAGFTYNFYLNYHGRDSIDGAGMPIISTVRYCPTNPAADCPYPNAFWNGSQMVYGEGYASADDVVGHEMTHGVTDHESHLFYYYQSGAINESLSDVWGEFIDQTDGYDGAGGPVRWLMGEDLTIGPIRNMADPTNPCGGITPCYGSPQPDKMSSSYYKCTNSDAFDNDEGGVHINSGINNKAAYLMTDGATFNGQTITGLGITKVAKIYYEVNTNLLTSAGDYQDLSDDLQQACTNLIGTAGITAGDCQQVQKAVQAVEMDTQPAGCAAPEAPICAAEQAPSYIFQDDFENPALPKWTSSAVSGTTNEWYYPENPNPYWDARYATSGDYNLFGIDIDTMGDYAMTMNSNVTLPAGTSYMHFNHSYGFQNESGFQTGTYDGGVLEYSTNNGSSWTDAGGLITDNGYNGTISSSGNPLDGRSGFVADSFGYTSSRLNLSSLAGQNVKFRFRIGTDSSGWDLGWYIDDVGIYTCQSIVPTNTPTPTRTRTPTPIGWTQPPLQNNFLSHLRKDLTSTPTRTITPTPTPILPTSTPPSTPSVIMPGYWLENDSVHYGSSEFYVTTNSANVDNFAVRIHVNGCGYYIITHTPLVPIKSKSFAFTGKFYASGTFDTYLTAHGKLGLKKFYISGCGYVTGGPFTYTSAWVNSSQPFTVEDNSWSLDPVTVVDAPSDQNFVIEQVEP